MLRSKIANSSSRAVRLVAGTIEISSGVLNTLLKLTGLNDTEFGITLSEYLFYLELLSLSGEVTAALRNRLTAVGKELLQHEASISKKLDDLIQKGEIDELAKRDLWEHLEEIAGSINGIVKLGKLEDLDFLKNAINKFNFDDLGRQISKTNCVNVVQSVDQYLKTGKLIKAEKSLRQSIGILENIYNRAFIRTRIPTLQLIMKEGETGIVYGIRNVKNGFSNGHVFNVIKRKDKLIFIDGQSGGLAHLKDGFIEFKYLKTN